MDHNKKIVLVLITLALLVVAFLVYRSFIKSSRPSLEGPIEYSVEGRVVSIDNNKIVMSVQGGSTSRSQLTEKVVIFNEDTNIFRLNVRTKNIEFSQVSDIKESARIAVIFLSDSPTSSPITALSIYLIQ